jgi:DnaK suppressor protein
VAKTGVAEATAAKKTAVAKDAAEEIGSAEEAKNDKVPVDQDDKARAKQPAAGVAMSGTDEGAAAEAPQAKPPRAIAAKKADGAHLAGSRGAEQGEPRQQFLENQRVLLMAERRNYTRQAEELRAQAEALALEHEPGDVQFDEEGGEGGTANVDRELDLHLSAQAHAAVEEIDAALDKITAGTYGFCESCGSPVPKARLEALPHARLCVSCKSGGLSARRQ